MSNVDIRALAEVTDPAERAYLLRWKHDPTTGRVWWSRMCEQEREPWRIAAEMRAETLREAVIDALRALVGDGGEG